MLVSLGLDLNRSAINDASIASKLQQALTFHKQGELSRAIALYESVLEWQPLHFDALHLAGTAATQKQEYQLAVEYFSKAVKMNPNHAAAHSNLGLALQMLNRHEDAIVNFQQALRIEPQNANTLYNCGNAWRALKLYEMALECYESLLQITPDDIDALFYTADVLFHLERLDAACSTYQRVLKTSPANVNVLNNLGIIFQRMMRFDEAITYFDSALRIAPDFASALFNRGNVLRQMNRPQDAVKDYEQVLLSMPEHHEVLNNKGNALRALNRLDEASVCYAQALQSLPSYADAYWNASLCHLLAGDFKQGWAKFEWRWTSELKAEARQFSRPAWDGKEALQGKTILLHAEQGFGDTLHFSRYVNMVQALGAKVLLEVQPQLVSVLAGLSGVDVLIARGHELPSFDYHCPLLSLPKVFATDAQTIPASIPYVFSKPELIDNWQERINKSSKPRVGIVWSGSHSHQNDHNRSIPLSRFVDIIQPEIQFYALQAAFREGDKHLLKEYPEITLFEAPIEGFSDTAALISLMDVVITVDTAVAHLAGAMGKPVWILLPYSPDWRWQLNRNDSPWYPTAKLFRQPAIGDWSSVLSEVKQALQVL